MAFDGRAMRVNNATYDRVTAVKKQLEQDRQRQVTYAETFDELVRHWEATEQLVRDARKAGR